jgi:predicted DNA-binding antitoxin AbrB/MazE fold protein
MTKPVEAIYENGLLRPLEPLPLNEHQRVTVVITEAHSLPERTRPDSYYVDAIRKEASSAGPHIDTRGDPQDHLEGPFFVG